MLGRLGTFKVEAERCETRGFWHALIFSLSQSWSPALDGGRAARLCGQPPSHSGFQQGQSSTSWVFVSLVLKTLEGRAGPPLRLLI